MEQLIQELIAAKHDSDRATARLKAAKAAIEKACPDGLNTPEVVVSFVAAHETSSYNWKKLEQAMEFDPTLAAIGKMFIELSSVKDAYRYRFYK